MTALRERTLARRSTTTRARPRVVGTPGPGGLPCRSSHEPRSAQHPAWRTWRVRETRRTVQGRLEGTGEGRRARTGMNPTPTRRRTTQEAAAAQAHEETPTSTSRARCRSRRAPRRWTNLGLNDRASMSRSEAKNRSSRSAGGCNGRSTRTATESRAGRWGPLHGCPVVRTTSSRSSRSPAPPGATTLVSIDEYEAGHGTRSAGTTRRAGVPGSRRGAELARGARRGALVHAARAGYQARSYTGPHGLEATRDGRRRPGRRRRARRRADDDEDRDGEPRRHDGRRSAPSRRPGPTSSAWPCRARRTSRR